MSLPQKSVNPEADSDNAINYKTSLTAIRKARRFLVQGLYEWLMTGNPAHEIEARTRSENAMHTVHLGYYHQLLHRIIESADASIDFIQSHLDRDWARLDKVEQAVLLVGTYELQHRIEIPYKVVLDEAIQLNTHFGSVEGHKLINVVMDKIAKQVRDPEVQADIKKAQLTDKPVKTSPVENSNETLQEK